MRYRGHRHVDAYPGIDDAVRGIVVDSGGHDYRHVPGTRPDGDRATGSRGFAAMGWSDYIPTTLKTMVFGFIIGAVSCFLGYTAKQGATGVGHAATRRVVLSSLLLILVNIILVKLTFFWFS